MPRCAKVWYETDTVDVVACWRRLRYVDPTQFGDGCIQIHSPNQSLGLPIRLRDRRAGDNQRHIAPAHLAQPSPAASTAMEAASSWLRRPVWLGFVGRTLVAG